MVNDYENLDPRFVEGLTRYQVNNIFIARLFWENSSEITPWKMLGNFIDFPGLDTWDEVYDKTYACIFKMVENKLVRCFIGNFEEYESELAELRPLELLESDSLAKNVIGEDILAEKEKIYQLMDLRDDVRRPKPIFFVMTRWGFEFMKSIMREHRPVFDELDRLAEDNPF